MKRIVLSIVALILFLPMQAAAETEQWRIFETGFESSRSYDNPPQDVKVDVTFTSLSGTERTIKAFWDGGDSWRVRFSPDEIGEWTYETSCTDSRNEGLHNQSGSFNCAQYSGNNPLYRNGELRLSQNRRYIEHQNGKPFFFLADTVWCGPAFANFNNWKFFLEDRVEKEFTAIQFVVAQWRMFEKDAAGNVTFTGEEKIKLNPAYFKRLDRYVTAINEAGLVAVPVVIWSLPGDKNPGHYLPEDQKIELAEYIVARYGAHQVMWFLGGDGNYEDEKAETWKNVGRAVFNDEQHRLVSMHAWGKSWVGDEFRGEPWFDFIVYQSGHGDDHGTFEWLTQGPPAQNWDEEPTLPVINSEPNYEAHNGYTHKKAHDAHSIRRASYWSLLVSPTAGVSYGGQGVWGWHKKVQAPADHLSTGLGSPWYIAKDLPGAHQMKLLHQFIKTLDWWRLTPAQELLADQPGADNPAEYVTAAKTGKNDTAVIYMPVGMEITVNTADLNVSEAKWFHPRTGGWINAGAVEKPQQSFKPSDRNDWVLVLTN